MHKVSIGSSLSRGKRTNQRQKHILYAAMAMNRRILDPHRADGSNVVRAKKIIWRKLTLELNRVGPKKDEAQWRKVWTDLRLGYRKKWEKAQKGQYILSNYEKRVISSCGMLDGPGVEDTILNTEEDLNSFFEFLQREELLKEPINVSSIGRFMGERSNSFQSDLYAESDTNEYLICQEKIKDDLGEEPEVLHEPSIECISDDEDEYEKPATITQAFRNQSIDLISDEEEETNIKQEIKHERSPSISPHFPVNENSTLFDNLPQMPQIEQKPVDTNLKVSSPQSANQLFSPPIIAEVASTSPASVINVDLCRRKKVKIKNATLKEIKKMHRNLLKESKKQTALLRKLVRGMQS